MRTRRLLLVTLSLCLTITVAGGRRRRAVGPGTPPVPGPCAVTGLPNFFYSTDGGAHWSGNAETPTTGGTWGFVVFQGEPETLVTVAGHTVLDSSDGGCTWTARHTITEDIHHTLHLVAGPPGRVFLWTEEFVLRYDRGVVIPIPIPEAIGGLGVDPGNGEHVRTLGLAGGVVRESFDGGMAWQLGGGSAGGHINSAAFDPSDFRHILAGVQNIGIRISQDGGKSWTSGAQAQVVCNMSFVTTRPDMVWVALPSGSSQAFIQRSTDGGAHLDPVAAVAGVENHVCLEVLVNPHDVNAAIVPFGGDFHLFDAVQKSVTVTNCCGGRQDRIAYSPTNPSRLYLYSARR